MGELKEIEQEEIYINMLKEQREKVKDIMSDEGKMKFQMEALKLEFAKKNEYISQLEVENFNIKSTFKFCNLKKNLKKKNWNLCFKKGTFMKN